MIRASMAAILLLAGIFLFINYSNKKSPQRVMRISAAKTADHLPPANPEKNCYFGDLHLHTSLSFDAFLFTTNTRPEDSYKYAMGESVNYLGRMVHRNAPLDFLAVTDHAEYLGVLNAVTDPKGSFAGTPYFKKFTNTNPDSSKSMYLQVGGEIMMNKPNPDFVTEAIKKSNWQVIIDAAEKYNKPGKFTTFIGYEWTSAPFKPGEGPQNLHRCVIFKGSKVPAMPFSAFDSQDPEKLWAYLENARKTGDDVIAMPHNGNASNGLMFDTKTFSGKAITKKYALKRIENEPLVEIIQGKGQSDTHPALSPNDEFSNFELWETLVGAPVKAHFFTGSYVRQAYGIGQEFYEKIGANPFKYGIEGSTDYHSGVSSTEENNYVGSHGNQDDEVRNFKQVLTDTASVGGEPVVVVGASGLTGVWAEENTRESIFNALKRKECFGTSGNRIKVRMFASWNYPADLIKRSDWVKDAYAAGVPMGADLPVNSAKAKAPIFIVEALKDPDGGNLDRIQIIKVSTKNGLSAEKIYDVVWSGDRKPDPATGKVPAVGTTVDLKTASYTNSIGVTSLAGMWTDPNFDPAAEATYYARVLEIPTPRWSTYLAVQHHMPLNPKVAASIQERAWTSPVWYTPAKR